MQILFKEKKIVNVQEVLKAVNATASTVETEATVVVTYCCSCVIISWCFGWDKKKKRGKGRGATVEQKKRSGRGE